MFGLSYLSRAYSFLMRACAQGMSKFQEFDSSPLFTFGIITDIQYADIDDKLDFYKTNWRRYRRALHILQEAVQLWCHHSYPVRFIIHVGDLIDGANKELNQTNQALQKVLNVFSEIPVRTFHTIGNHEMYNFSREEIIDGPLFPRELTFDHSSSLIAAGICDKKVNSERCYYSFSPHKKFLVIVLDCYEVSVLGYSPEHPNYKLAEEVLRNRNPNENWNSPSGLKEYEKRFAEYNGGVSQTQLDWLNALLKTATSIGQKVILVGHISVFFRSIKDKSCLVWNYDEILNIIYNYKCVVAYISGHDHNGGYAVDEHGIHHLTLPAVVEAPLDESAFGICDVYENYIQLTGHGTVASRCLKFCV